MLELLEDILRAMYNEPWPKEIRNVRPGRSPRVPAHVPGPPGPPP